MALDAGSVVISPTGGVSGAGLSRALYDGLLTLFPSSPAVAAKQGSAAFANMMASVFVQYLKDNAIVVISKEAIATGLPASTTEAGTLR